MDGFHPLNRELDVVKKTPVSMAFDGSEPLEVWQKRARAELSGLLGLEKFEKCEDAFKIEYENETEEFKETRFLFQSEPGYYVPCHFLEPKTKKSEKPPVMICLQGHSTGMHISLHRVKFEGDEKSFDGDRDFAIQCIKKGMCAVAVEQRGFGERGGEPRPRCHETTMTMLLTGRTMIGARVWDISRLIDVLEKRFDGVCDTKKVYCCGNSGGGTATFYAAALDERIAAAMPSCALCTYEDSIASRNHCVCNFVPHIREYFDMAELGGMIAPRPLAAVSGTTDGIFPLDAAKYEFERIKNIYYKNSSKPENCVHIIGPEGHRFYKELAWEQFEKLI